MSTKTGLIHWHCDWGDNEEALPDDIDDSEEYIAIPHKNDLGLGKPLALQFAEEFLPSALHEVQEIFRQPGAYGRFKDLLDHHAMLQRWYEYESKAQEHALRDWCTDREIAVDG